MALSLRDRARPSVQDTEFILSIVRADNRAHDCFTTVPSRVSAILAADEIRI
jgi:hypothetical protein